MYKSPIFLDLGLCIKLYFPKTLRFIYKPPTLAFLKLNMYGIYSLQVILQKKDYQNQI